jgi:hypothetical protein
MRQLKMGNVVSVREQPMILERVVYCSTASGPTESLLFISQILGVSERNNARDELTGALAVSDGWFLQVIEGLPHRVDHLLARLEADRRHKNIEILQRRPIAARLFTNWSMVSVRVTPDLGPALLRLIDECRVSPDAAIAGLLEILALETAKS